MQYFMYYIQNPGLNYYIWINDNLNGENLLPIWMANNSMNNRMAYMKTG